MCIYTYIEREKERDYLSAVIIVRCQRRQRLFMVTWVRLQEQRIKFPRTSGLTESTAKRRPRNTYYIIIGYIKESNGNTKLKAALSHSDAL